MTVDGRERLVDAATVDGDTYSLVCLSNRQQSIQAGLAETALPGELAVHMANGVATVRVLAGGASRFGRGTGSPGRGVRRKTRGGADARQDRQGAREGR